MIRAFRKLALAAGVAALMALGGGTATAKNTSSCTFEKGTTTCTSTHGSHGTTTSHNGSSGSNGDHKTSGSCKSTGSEQTNSC